MRTAFVCVDLYKWSPRQGAQLRNALHKRGNERNIPKVHEDGVLVVCRDVVTCFDPRDNHITPAEDVHHPVPDFVSDRVA